jgi:F-type H+-transporting ATPase subunit b
MKFVLASAIFVTEYAFAAGGGPLDLIPAFLNFGILFLFLGWKLKKPLTGYFSNKSDEIKSILDRANVKAKEAEMMMQMQKKKIDGMNDEINKIKADVELQASEFKNNYVKEIDERIVKLKEDANVKVEAERKEQMAHLNETILNNVISKTKTILKNDSSLSEAATKRVLEGYRG